MWPAVGWEQRRQSLAPDPGYYNDAIELKLRFSQRVIASLYALYEQQRAICRHDAPGVAPVPVKAPSVLDQYLSFDGRHKRDQAPLCNANTAPTFIVKHPKS